MAKVALQKIRVTGMKSHYKEVMTELQKSESIHIIDEKKSAHEASLATNTVDLARIDFTIRFLLPYQNKSDKVESILSGGKLVITEEELNKKANAFAPKLEEIVSQCEDLEVDLVKNNNRLKELTTQQEYIKFCLPLGAQISDSFDTAHSSTLVGKIASESVEILQTELAGISNLLEVEKLGEGEKVAYLRITSLKTLQKEVLEITRSFNLELLDLGKEFSGFHGKSLAQIHADLEQEKYKINKNLETINKKIIALTKNISELKLVSDHATWENEVDKKKSSVTSTQSIFTFDGWVARNNLNALEKWMKNRFSGEVFIEGIKKEQSDQEPVLLKNSPLLAPFEDVTKMYALPAAKDLDPTAYLAPFFIVFFGLCLSDVGYGLILTAVASWFLFFGHFEKEIKKSLMLVLMCGISAVFGGIILGGYFGMSVEQAPAFLVGESGMFKGQLLNPLEGSGPIIFLGIALGMGALQLLIGIALDFFNRIRRNDISGAFADSGAWFFFLASLLAFAVADFVPAFDKALLGNLSLLGAGILILTQGRDQKNWLLKPLFGLLGLYNITGYLSDLLSYARIMALGLATGVVGFAMNMTAGVLSDMMPHWTLGVLIALIIIIFGHTLNFLLALLGAFIHSGRLQFIEFFGKFYEGGGKAFAPFARKKKYVFIKE